MMVKYSLNMREFAGFCRLYYINPAFTVLRATRVDSAAFRWYLLRCAPRAVAGAARAYIWSNESIDDKNEIFPRH
jgi:hypothetical protein